MLDLLNSCDCALRAAAERLVSGIGYQQNMDIAVYVPERVIGQLLMEMAWSRGYAAWPDEELPGIVWLRCKECQIEEILELARLPGELMMVRSLENLARAILATGDMPSEELKQAIEIGQGCYLGKLWAEINGSGNSPRQESCRGSVRQACEEVQL